MRRLIIMAAMLGTSLYAAAICGAVELKTEEQKTFYAVGLAMAKSLTVFNLTPDEFEFVKQGLTDAQSGKKPAVELGAYTEKVQVLARSRRSLLGEKAAVAGKKFAEDAAKEKGAVKTESGLIFTMLKEGAGETPKPTDTAKVNYRGTLIDGKEFDSSYKRGTPAEFKLNAVIKCWTEGLQKMKAGGKAKLVCPPAIAYGENGAGELILPGATLVFEVELLEIKK